MDYDYYMKEAYKEAISAYEIGEVPIGAVIVHENKIIARGYNQRNTAKNALMHAEIIAINEGCKVIGDWRLEDAFLFVTVEPCPMCAGAILQSRIKTLVFGTKNKKAGSCGSIINILNQEGFNHRTEIIEGIMQAECAALMSNFFKSLRNK